jgi:hypothetical protein
MHSSIQIDKKDGGFGNIRNVILIVTDFNIAILRNAGSADPRQNNQQHPWRIE